MWHQHVCLIGCLAAIMVCIDGCIMLCINVHYNLDAPDEFYIGQTLQNVHRILRNRAKVQVIGSLICICYWLVAYLVAVFPPSLTGFVTKVRAYTSFGFWHLLVQPYLLVSLAHSVYIFALVLEETGYFHADFHQFFLNLFGSMRNQTDVCKRLDLIQYTENLQHRFRCCGAYSLADWVGVDVQISTNQSSSDSDPFWATEDGQFYPYYKYPVYIPPSCCNSEQIHKCSQKMFLEIGDTMKRDPSSLASKSFPVHPVGCVDAVALAVGEDLSKRIIVTFTLSVVLHIIQCACCFFAYHRSKPTHWEVRRPIDGGPHNSRKQSILFGESEKSEKVPHYRIFRGSYGFVSNSQILTAYHGLALLAHPTTVQRALSAVKDRWLEKGIKIGWSLKHSKVSSKPTFVRRLSLRPDVKIDNLRDFLRRHIPLLEAVLYADNDIQGDVEVNAVYYSYIVCMLRLVFHFAYGAVIAQALVKTFVPTYADTGTSDNNIMSAIPEKTERVSEDPIEAKIKEDNIELSKQVALYSSLFIRMAIIFGAVFSRRCRCIYLLLIPSLGLTVGQSYIAAELLHVTLTGPAATAEKNLRYAAGTLNCLIDLAKNISRDATKVYDEARLGDQMTGSKGYIDQVKESSRSLLDKMDEYQDSANRILSEITKSEEMAQKAETLLNKDDDGESDEGGEGSTDTAKPGKDESTVISMNKKLKDGLMALTNRMKDRDHNNSKAMLEKSKHTIRKMLSKLGSTAEMVSNVTAKIEAGAEIERMMKRRLIATCMVFHKSRGIICSKSAVAACRRVEHTVRVFMLYIPINIADPCIKSAAEGSACPTDSAIEKAVEECGSSIQNIGMNPGFGAMFYQAMDNLRELSESFNMKIQSKLFEVPNKFNWVSQRLSAAATVTRKTQNAVQVLFSLSLILSTLLKLLAPLIFYKACKYTTKYLTDVEFDNIYVEDTFEAIDARRVKQGRENLLPLKGFEQKKVFWRRLGYTKAELGKVFITVIKCMGLCFGLLMIFIVDIYLAESISLLDVATQGGFRVSGADSEDNKEEGIASSQAPRMMGDGIFYTLLGRTLEVLAEVSKKKMNYELSICSPRVQYTLVQYKTRFTIAAIIMILVGMFSGYLIRSRHIIVNFFYPMQMKSRIRHLYNALLVDRRRHMTICRNVLVHQVRQGNLQYEAEERSQKSVLFQMSPYLSKLFGMNKASCILCLNRFKIGHEVYICPYDDTVICNHCLQLYFKHLDEDCILCLDREPARLLCEYKKCARIKRNLAMKGFGKHSEV